MIFIFSQKSRACQQGISTTTQIIQTRGPDEDKIKQILERTGYSLDVTTGKFKKRLSFGESGWCFWVS